MSPTRMFLEVARELLRAPDWAPGVRLWVNVASDDSVEVSATKGLGRDIRHGVAVVSPYDVQRCCDVSAGKTVDAMRALLAKMRDEACRRAGFRLPMPEHEKRWRKARAERLVWKRRAVWVSG